MKFSHILVYVLAAIGVIYLLLLFIFLLVTPFCQWIEEKINEKYKKTYNENVKQIGYKINDAHYWFSSEPKLYNLLALISESLIEYQTFDISRIREMVNRLGNKRYKPMDVPSEETDYDTKGI